ncbi:hypothetical protein DFH09DRAFT_1083441 [Mycena vulgaris]|nr:hypothetical protein DFH09DRAFT_1083441 [Mycena vulgaris]
MEAENAVLVMLKLGEDQEATDDRGRQWDSKSGFLMGPGGGGAGDSFGTTNSSYAVIINNIAQKIGTAQAEVLIFTTSSLKDGVHNLTVAVRLSRATQQFAFDRAAILSPIYFAPQILERKIIYESVGLPDPSLLRQHGHATRIQRDVESRLRIGRPKRNDNYDNRPIQENIHRWLPSSDVPDALRFFLAGFDPAAVHAHAREHEHADDSVAAPNYAVHTRRRGEWYGPIRERICKQVRVGIRVFGYIGDVRFVLYVSVQHRLQQHQRSCKGHGSTGERFPEASPRFRKAWGVGLRLGDSRGSAEGISMQQGGIREPMARGETRGRDTPQKPIQGQIEEPSGAKSILNAVSGACGAKEPGEVAARAKELRRRGKLEERDHNKCPQYPF